MKYMSEYEIIKLLDNLDREYVAAAKSATDHNRKSFATKAHFVINRIKKEFKEKFKENSL